VWRSFEVAKEVDEKVVWVRAAGVFILGGVRLVGLGMGAFVMFLGLMSVGEDNDFIHAEDTEGACYVAAE
jgi:hypothetical protein